ncbi:MAG: TRAP transporter small permease [Gammaproteobacteria bacterium]|nr:TRAP transporter small permease [Gammaproteobacteria bacterium]MBU0848410.1 TRAP transporter small permease [Gammaproteobacteria bacterium]MBU1268187.1 TRAP transporter small permease [Gammaproteobacteria bacterium]MBU1529219.1 TRAP transporter small permease [Gammaproteobacteria bacterium]MBU1780381.1 TRAP transporter small permease [Gammaproteobacteria bacterium]
MNNPLWRLFSGTVRGVNQAMAYLSALLILICSLVLVYEVVTRYILQVSNDWVIELSIFMLIAATFLAAAHTQRERGHVGIEVLDEVMSKRASRYRLLLGDILSMLFCGLVAYLSAVYCFEAWDQGWTTSSTWGPPLWIPYFFMALGMLLLTLQFIVQIIEGLMGKVPDLPSHSHASVLGD